MQPTSLDTLRLPAHVLAEQLASGRVKSVQLVQGFLERIRRHDGTLGSFSAVYTEAVRAAEAADQAIACGHRIGPLHGIPVMVKDLFDIHGKVTTCGSKVWEHRVAERTATVVRRLIGAGVSGIGKNKTAEFAASAYGTNEHMGTPRNPWDLESHRAPGGSSSGTGAAVAASLGPWGVGTDTGGSVRIPASWCGITSLKTTIGRISTHGVHPLAESLDTPGPMCRDAQDCALLLDVLQGPDPLDPRTLRCSPNDPFATLKRGAMGLVIGTLQAAEREMVEPEVLAAYDEGVRTLASLGAQILEVRLPRTLSEMASRVGMLLSIEGYSHVGSLIEDARAPLDDDVRRRIAVYRDMSAAEYLRLLREHESLKLEWNAALEGVDALVTPTTAMAAPRLDEIDQDRVVSGFTRPINLVDWCALAVPNGMTSIGLPTSMQIACRGYSEAMALRIGWAYQQSTSWHRRMPQLD
jgi:aspartyl-tRNA(Asn)/glutamyl-tRNA(Gln) amidotransferase subunit A